METPIVTRVAETPPEAPGPQPQSPTTTHYQQVAEQYLRDLDALTAIIPKQEVSQLSSKKHVRAHLNVNREFLEVCIGTVDQAPELKGTGQLEPVAARDDLQYLEAFRPVLDKLDATSARLRFALQAVKARLVVGSQRVYHITKGLARDPDKPELAKRLVLMKQALGRRGPGRKRKKAGEQTPTPTPAPATPPATPAPAKEGKG